MMSNAQASNFFTSSKKNFFTSKNFSHIKQSFWPISQLFFVTSPNEDSLKFVTEYLLPRFSTIKLSSTFRDGAFYLFPNKNISHIKRGLLPITE